MTSFRRVVQEVFRRAGYQIHKSDAMHSGEVRRALLLRKHAINVVLDVGANRGQYGRELRQYGYDGRLISFEPLREPFQSLRRCAESDESWDAVNAALGDSNGTARLNVSRNTEWSSLLDLAGSFADAPAGAAVVEQEDIRVQKLEDIYWSLVGPSDRVYLKMDTQGYERKVLEGSLGVLPHVLGVQMELSLERFYEDEELFPEMVSLMKELDFNLMSMNPVNVSAQSGRIRQVDGIFFREA